jgi:hypothetical protein
MNQSIEDASRKDFEAWFLNDMTPRLTGSTSMVESLTWQAWQAARQSSQSEPVYQTKYSSNDIWWEITEEEYLNRNDALPKRKLFLAAPQQAIPSGYALVPNEVLVSIKNLPRFTFLSPPEGGVRRFADTSGNWIEQYEVIKLIDDYIYSASPTAPIERDK